MPSREILTPQGESTTFIESITSADLSDILTTEIVLSALFVTSSKRPSELMSIPEGSILSYTELAKSIVKPKAVRAVASACAKNRIGVLIPCHRVLRGDGTLGGYRWGLDRKRALLDKERLHRQG